MTSAVPKIIQFPKIGSNRGNLTFVEGSNHIPFDIARAFWIYEVPAGENRGSHAHYTLQEVVVAVSGSFDVTITDGFTERVFRLMRPYEGLYLPPGFWISLGNFAAGSVCVTLCSQPYDESDYIRNRRDYQRLARANGPRW